MTNKIQAVPLTSSVAARIEGIDLRGEVSASEIEQVREALWKHSVLVFEGQNLTAVEHLRLTGFFGVVQPYEVFSFLGETNPGVAVDPDNGGFVGEDGKAAARVVNFERRPKVKTANDHPRISEFPDWHTDSSFMKRLPQAAALRAEIVPPVGGDTSFASMCAAYDALSPTMQDWLKDARAIHAYPPDYKNSIQPWQYGEDAEERFDAEYQPREHPVVIEHPESRRKALFVNPVYTIRMVGMTDRESEHMLRLLFIHMTSSEFVYRHHWTQPGDIVVWDEMACMHLAPTDFDPHPRRLVRLTSGSVAPTAPAAAEPVLVS